MKVIGLKAENIKRLKAVNVDFGEGNLFKITGRNGAGKSSLMDCIEMAICGKSSVPDEPIRRGAKKGFTSTDLGELVATRTFSQKGGTSLKLVAKDGKAVKSPQAVLDKLKGNLTFDPLEFSRMDPKKQGEVLRDLVGIDTREIDLKITNAYDERREIGREVKSFKAQYEAIEVPENAPSGEVSVTAIAQEIRHAEENNRSIDSFNHSIELINTDVKTSEQRIKKLKEEIKALQSSIRTDKEEAQILEKTRDKLKIINIAELEKQMSQAEENNSIARQVKEKEEIKRRYNDTGKKYEYLTTTIESLEAEKLELVESAEYPLDGLSVSDGEVLYNDLPLAQASSAEKLRVSVSIAMALNPELRIIMIKDGSLLDSDNIAEIEKLAKDRDFLVLIEMVDESGEVGIVIEDGEVVNQGEAP
jgi:DNA repair exonuclease SbcCD ATPase subunit